MIVDLIGALRMLEGLRLCSRCLFFERRCPYSVEMRTCHLRRVNRCRLCHCFSPVPPELGPWAVALMASVAADVAQPFRLGLCGPMHVSYIVGRALADVELFLEQPVTRNVRREAHERRSAILARALLKRLSNKLETEMSKVQRVRATRYSLPDAIISKSQSDGCERSEEEKDEPATSNLVQSLIELEVICWCDPTLLAWYNSRSGSLDIANFTGTLKASEPLRLSELLRLSLSSPDSWQIFTNVLTDDRGLSSLCVRFRGAEKASAPHCCIASLTFPSSFRQEVLTDKLEDALRLVLCRRLRRDGFPQNMGAGWIRVEAKVESDEDGCSSQNANKSAVTNELGTELVGGDESEGWLTRVSPWGEKGPAWLSRVRKIRM